MRDRKSTIISLITAGVLLLASVVLIFDGVHFSPSGHAAFALGLSKALRECEQTTGPESAFG